MSIDVTPSATASLSRQVGTEIRVFLTRHDLRQSHLAREMGVGEQWLSVRLRGVQPIDLNDLHGIVQALRSLTDNEEVTIADLLPRCQRAVTNGSSPTLVPVGAEPVTAPHPVDVRSGAGHSRHHRTGRTGRSLQYAIVHSPAVA